jgi:hypothetical protein
MSRGVRIVKGRQKEEEEEEEEEEAGERKRWEDVNVFPWVLSISVLVKLGASRGYDVLDTGRGRLVVAARKKIHLTALLLYVETASRTGGRGDEEGSLIKASVVFLMSERTVQVPRVDLFGSPPLAPRKSRVLAS